MGIVYIFIWESSDFHTKKGYVRSAAKAERIRKKLVELLNEYQIDWYTEGTVEGWNLHLTNFENIKESDVK